MAIRMLNILSNFEALPQLAYLPEFELPSSIDCELERRELLRQCAKALKCEVSDVLVMIPYIDDTREFYVKFIHNWDPDFIFELKKTGRASFNPDTKLWFYHPHEYKNRARDAALGEAVCNSRLEYVVSFIGNRPFVFKNPY